MTDVNEIVHDCLAMARKIIADGEHWSPMVLLIHAVGIEVLAISGMGKSAEEKQQVAKLIKELMTACRATLALMITDVWQAEVQKTDPMPRSLQSPFPGRTEALQVTMWGPGQPTTVGMQTYTRDAQGKPVFAPFWWQDPGERSWSLFAGDDLAAVTDDHRG